VCFRYLDNIREFYPEIFVGCVEFVWPSSAQWA